MSMIAVWNVHGSGSLALGNLGDSLNRIKRCQLYACTIAIVQVQEKKHECSAIGLEFATVVNPRHLLERPSRHLQGLAIRAIKRAPVHQSEARQVAMLVAARLGFGGGGGRGGGGD